MRGVKWSTWLIKRTRTAHKVAGYLAWFSTFFTLTSGLKLYAKDFDDSLNYLVPINIAGMISIYLIFEINFRIIRNSKVEIKKDLPIMSLDEF